MPQSSLRRRVAVVAALALAAAACGTANNSSPGTGGYPPSADTPKPTGDIDSFTWALYAEPPVLDYIYAFDYPQNTVVANVCESLMRWTPQLTVEPGLAEKAENPDQKTWVYTIRSGVKFHSGAEMTADDVVYSLRRHMDPELGSYWIANFKNVASIDKTGPRQVTVKLKVPDSQFAQAMANSTGTVASAESIRAQGKKFGTADGGLDCTGPYRLGTWNRGQSIELDRFDGYWGRRAKAGRVVFTFLPDSSARTNALLTGEADGTFAVPPESYGRLGTGGAGKLYFGEGLTTVNVNVTNLKGTLKDVRVRQALLLALDRQGFVKSAMRGVGSPTSALATRAAWRGVPQATVDGAYSGLPGIERDLERAERLIQEAGATGKKLVVATSPIGPDVSLLATALQDAGTRIGLKVELRTVAPDAFTALFSDPKAREGLDLFPYTYYLSITDPLGIYGNFRTGDFENYAGYRDPDYDKLVDQATQEYDVAKRGAVTAQLQKLAIDQMLCIPVAEYPAAVFLSKRITGAPTTISYLYYPWAADVGAAG